MKLIYIKLFCLFICLVPIELLAQNILKGVVKDEFGTVPSASVVLLNKDDRVVTGVVTNDNGEYFLTLPADTKGMSISFSFIGLKTQKIAYTGQAVLNVTLQESTSTALQAVEVSAKAVSTGFMGINSDNTGVARQKLDLDEFQDMSVVSVADMLQGKLTNVDIIGGGDPGTKSTIRIRGTSSLTGSNEPLIVIDDIPVDTEINSDFDFGSADVDDFGGLVGISPNDIESIDVLKDAGATALYGSKAANGVLLIKTKRGRAMKTQFGFSQKFTYISEPKSVKMLNAAEYTTLMEDALWNTMQFRGFDKYSEWKQKYESLHYDPMYEYFNEFNQDTNWLDLVTRNTLGTTTDFNMAGGGDRASYRFSLGHLSEKGTTIGTDYTRLTARLNLDYKLSSTIRVTSDFSYSESDRDAPYANTHDKSIFKNGVRSIAQRKMPSMSPYIIDKVTGEHTDQYFTQPSTSIQGLQPNPVAWVDKSKNNTFERSTEGKFIVNYNPIPELTLNGTMSFTLRTTKYKQYMPAEASGLAWVQDENVQKDYYNNAFNGNSSGMTIYAKMRATYAKSFEKHRVTLSAVADPRESSTTAFSSGIRAIGSSELADPSAGGISYLLKSGKNKNRQIGVTGQGLYEYDSRYNVSVGIRSEANSQTGRNSRWGTFPTLTAQWRVNNEPFLIDQKWVSDMRLNLSWGKSGNAPKGSYTYVGTFTTENPYMNMPTVKPNNMQLNSLKWEVSTSYNIGYKLGLLDDRIELDVDIYNKKTDDLLRADLKLPSSSGYDKVDYFNSGSLENRGWEISLNLNNIIKTKDFTFSIMNLNIARNRNVIKDLPMNVQDEEYTNDNRNYANKVLVDRPLGSFYGYNCLGVYQNVEETYAKDPDGNIIRDTKGEPVFMKYFGTTQAYPGDAKYADHNYDGVIDKYDMVYLGNSMPTIIGGGAVRFTYKGWMLRASFQFRLGQKVINSARMDAEAMYNGNNQRKSVLKRWRYEGDDTDIPRALFGHGYNYLGSDRFVEDNSFLKCKDVTVSYTLPKKLLSSFGIQRCNVFLTTYNLFTITNYTGQDPETQIPGGFKQLATDDGFTPPARRIAFGFSLGI